MTPDLLTFNLSRNLGTLTCDLLLKAEMWEP
jgi:hypothetical protein